MTHEHDVLRDLLAPVALGAAEPDEVARVEAHATECAVCREELAACAPRPTSSPWRSRSGSPRPPFASR